MIEKITLDMLTADSVSLKKQNVTTIGGVEYLIGQPWRKAYTNSVQGREQAQAEVPEPYLSAVMAVWGNTPTVIGQTE